jgi:hypothetical protein
MHEAINGSITIKNKTTSLLVVIRHLFRNRNKIIKRQRRKSKLTNLNALGI